MLSIPVNQILFLDIETVPICSQLSEMSDEMQQLWGYKFEQVKRRQQIAWPEEADEAYGFANGAGVFAEFGKVVCISVGFIYFQNNEPHFKVKSYASKDEKQLLMDFAAMSSNFLNSKDRYVCGHNVKEFDIPFICRRMLVHGLKLPAALQVAGKRPWETSFIDTLELWKFGDYKHYTSLKLLTALFGIPTPKDDIDGSQVAQVYYEEDNLQRIATYCEKDVVATAQLYLRFCGRELLDNVVIEHVPLVIA